jgi:hypothetical protein
VNAGRYLPRQSRSKQVSEIKRAAPARPQIERVFLTKKLENSLHRFGDQPQPAVRGLARGVAESSGLDGQVARLIYETDGSFFWKSRLAG